MSYGFNINGPRSKPTIIEAQSMQNNGGGGNCEERTEETSMDTRTEIRDCA